MTERFNRSMADRLYATCSAGDISRQMAERAESVVAYLLPNGKRANGHWVVGNVHGDEGQSLKVTLAGEHAGRWKDWASEEGGDLLDLWKVTRRLDTAEAIKDANLWLGNPAPPPAQKKNTMNQKSKAVHTWHYPEKDGITGKVVRFEHANGKKFCLPYFPATREKSGIEQGFITPLYGTVGDYVFIVEGEKCVDAMAQMGLNAVTCQGSASGVSKADWTMLDSTDNICFLPDNDEAGEEYVEAVAEALAERRAGRVPKVLRLEGLPHKGDIVDWIQARNEGWDGYAPDERIAPLGGEFKLFAKQAEVYAPQAAVPSMFIKANKVPMEAIDWLVEDYIETETVTWFYGESQAFKTFLLLCMACAIAGGKPWGPDKRCKKGRVLYVCGEGYKGIRRRLEAWSRHTGLSIPDNLYISMTSTNLSDPKAVEKLVQELQQIGGVSLVIIDTFARNYGGEENSNDAIGNFYHVAEHHIVKPFKCTVLVSHHPGKDASKGARGGASIKQNSDAMYKVERCDSGNRWLTKLECEKMKDAEMAPDALFEALRIEIGITDKYGKEMTSLAMQHVDYKEQKDIQRQQRDEQAADDAEARLRLLHEINKDGSLVQQDYAALIGVNQSRVSRHMNKLREQGFIKGSRSKLKVTPDGRNMLFKGAETGA